MLRSHIRDKFSNFFSITFKSHFHTEQLSGCLENWHLACKYVRNRCVSLISNDIVLIYISRQLPKPHRDQKYWQPLFWSSLHSWSAHVHWRRKGRMFYMNRKESKNGEDYKDKGEDYLVVLKGLCLFRESSAWESLQQISSSWEKSARGTFVFTN